MSGASGGLGGRYSGPAGVCIPSQGSSVSPTSGDPRSAGPEPTAGVTGPQAAPGTGPPTGGRLTSDFGPPAAGIDSPAATREADPEPGPAGQDPGRRRL